MLHRTQLCDTSSDFYGTLCPTKWCFTQLMQPYWKVNKEAWSSANKGWVHYDGDTFQLAGRKREEKKDSQQKSLLRALLTCRNWQSRDQGPFMRFCYDSTWGRQSQDLLLSPLQCFFPQSRTANPEPVSQLQDNRKQCPSSHLYLTLLITLMDCVAIKKGRGGCQLRSACFPSRMGKKEGLKPPLQTTSEAHRWEHELYCP